MFDKDNEQKNMPNMSNRMRLISMEFCIQSAQLERCDEKLNYNFLN